MKRNKIANEKKKKLSKAQCQVLIAKIFHNVAPKSSVSFSKLVIENSLIRVVHFYTLGYKENRKKAFPDHLKENEILKITIFIVLILINSYMKSQFSSRPIFFFVVVFFALSNIIVNVRNSSF